MGICLVASSPVIQSNVISDNTGYGLYLENNSFPANTGNTYSGNEYGIAVAAGEITISGAWSRDGAEPYVVLGDVSIDNWQGDAVLTIPAGWRFGSRVMLACS